MAETLTPLQQLKEGGISGDLYLCSLRFWPASKMTEEQYKFIGANRAALLTELIAEETVNPSVPYRGPNYPHEPDLTGLKLKSSDRCLIVGNDYYLWPATSAERTLLGCPDDPENWRPDPTAY